MTTFVLRATFAILAVAVLPGVAPAQEPGRWQVVPAFGLQTYDEATPFENAGFIGGEVHFPASPAVSFGLSLTFARPKVDGSYFPLALFRVAADTLVLYAVGQQTSQVAYAGLISLGASLGGAYAYVQGGAGGYTFFLDSQANDQIRRAGGETTFGGLLIPVGAGLSYRLGERAGIRFAVRDDIFTGFERERFNPVEPRFQNVCGADHEQNLQICFPERNPGPPEAKDVVHNLRFMLGFEFTPGGR